jgi:formate dehydrogenase major subunit
MARSCGIDAATIRTVARLYARSEAAIIFWARGVSQHTHGTDNARCLISLAMLCGQTGRKGTGLASAQGPEQTSRCLGRRPHPHGLPDLQQVGEPATAPGPRRSGAGSLDPEPASPWCEIMHAMNAGTIKGMYIMARTRRCPTRTRTTPAGRSPGSTTSWCRTSS